jgi:cobaltochelatase CobS
MNTMQTATTAEQTCSLPINTRTMGVGELQKLARAAASAFGHSKTWIAAATKDALIGYIQNPEAGAPNLEIPAGSDLVAMLNKIISELQAKGQNVGEIIGDKVSVKTPKQQKIEGLHHEQFPKLMRYIGIGLRNPETPLNIWLVGPAGTGKTTAARNAAKELGAKFEVVGVTDNEYKLKGFIDANGRIVDTAFRKAWTSSEPYVLCLDEIDGWLPGAQIALNSALANGCCEFPDGTKERNPQLAIICGANTLHGPTGEYVARFKPDAAFTDRFVQIQWDVDGKLERAIAKNDAWVDYVQHCRKNAAERGVKVVISPRASFTGAMLLREGEPWKEVVEACVRKGFPTDQWRAISEGAPVPSVEVNSPAMAE